MEFKSSETDEKLVCRFDRKRKMQNVNGLELRRAGRSLGAAQLRLTKIPIQSRRSGIQH